MQMATTHNQLIYPNRVTRNIKCRLLCGVLSGFTLFAKFRLSEYLRVNAVFISSRKHAYNLPHPHFI